jgi:hypothetical protein
MDHHPEYTAKKFKKILQYIQNLQITYWLLKTKKKTFPRFFTRSIPTKINRKNEDYNVSLVQLVFMYLMLRHLLREVITITLDDILHGPKTFINPSIVILIQ